MAYETLTAGLLKKRIEIQSPMQTRGEYLEPLIVWETFLSVYAAVEPITGREQFLNRELSGELTVRIRMRAREGVSEKMRVIYKTRVLEIQSVVNKNEAGVEMELLCSEFKDG